MKARHHARARQRTRRATRRQPSSAAAPTVKSESDSTPTGTRNVCRGVTLRAFTNPPEIPFSIQRQSVSITHRRLSSLVDWNTPKFAFIIAQACICALKAGKGPSAVPGPPISEPRSECHVPLPDEYSSCHPEETPMARVGSERCTTACQPTRYVPASTLFLISPFLDASPRTRGSGRHSDRARSADAAWNSCQDSAG